MKFPELKLPKLKFREGDDDWETYSGMDPTKKYQYRDVYKGQQLARADEVYPETMTSRLIVLGILSIIFMIIAWYTIGLAEFAGAGFTSSIRNAAGGGNSGNQAIVSTEAGSQSGSQTGVDSSVDGSGQGQAGVDSELARFEQQAQPAEPKSLQEFRQVQGMDFDTYLKTYYQMASAENSGLHWYLSSITGDKYDWFEIYRMWEEITKNNYAAYLAMYNGSTDTAWENGNSENYISSDLGVESDSNQVSNDSNDSNDSNHSNSGESQKVGDLSLGGVTLKSCVRHVSFWKIFITLLVGLLTWAIGYPLMKRNLEVQNQGKDNRHLLQYPNDQHIQMPEEMQRNYDYFPDVGAHCPVQASSMISHVMLLNKGVKTVFVARRAESDMFDEAGEQMYAKGEILLDEDGQPIMDEMPMFDKKFGVALFKAAKVLDDKRARVFYNPAKIPYNPGDENRDKLKGAKTVSDMINKYWSFPEYEPQRPAGAYLVDTAPVNTMILAITRAGKGGCLAL